MRIELGPGFDVEFDSPAELARLIPKRLGGKVLNYGQGEGQLQIDAGVWGFYVGDSGLYYLAFEEGTYEHATFLTLVRELTSHIEGEFEGDRIRVIGSIADRMSE